MNLLTGEKPKASAVEITKTMTSWLPLPCYADALEWPVMRSLLEADVSSYNLSDAHGIWTDATNIWNGIMICYDVAEPNSLRQVEDILREFYFRCKRYHLIDVECRHIWSSLYP